MGRFGLDVKLAIRQFAKAPLVFSIVIATLAICVGANSAIFSIVDALLLRPLPVDQPNRLVWMTNSGAYGTEAFSPAALFNSYRDNCSACEGVLAFVGPEKWSLTIGGRNEYAEGEIVSGNYFTVLGVRPLLGRALTPDDEKSHRPVAVLSFEYWKRTFGSSPAAIGESIRLGDTALTVVGVMPRGFFGTVVGNSPDLFVPLNATPMLERFSVVIMGRLKPGVSLKQAQTAIEPLFREYSSARVAAVASRAPAIAPLMEQLFTRPVVLDASNGISQLRVQVGLPVRILMWIVTLVLLIGCVNLASLLLMRSIHRRKEFAMRTALGATRWDLCRSVVTEALLLVSAGTLFGLILARGLITFLVSSFSHDLIPGAVRTADVVIPASLDIRVLSFTALLVAATTVFSSVIPAAVSTRLSPMEDLKIGGSQGTKGSGRLGRILAIGQVAALVVLLFGAAMLVRSFINLQRANVGFDPDHVLVVTLNKTSGAQGDQKPAENRFNSFYAQFSSRLAALPGVLSVSSSAITPMSGAEGAPVDVTTQDGPAPQRLHPDVFYSWVSPRYFETLGIPLLQGREFTSEDSVLSTNNSVAPVIVNRALAQRLFGYTNPIEKQFRVVLTGQTLRIVGLVEDSRFHDLREGPVPVFFSFRPINENLEIRTAVRPNDLSPVVRELAASIDSTISVKDIGPLREEIGRSLYRDRLLAIFCSSFGIVAALLACLGLYGFIAFDGNRRRIEVGVRIAVGATRGNIFRLFIRRAMQLATLGTLLGIFFASSLAWVYRATIFGPKAFNVYNPGMTGASGFIPIDKAFLFGVRFQDPITIISVVAGVFGVSLVAAFLPAMRASRAEPAAALKSE